MGIIMLAALLVRTQRTKQTAMGHRASRSTNTCIWGLEMAPLAAGPGPGLLSLGEYGFAICGSVDQIKFGLVL